MITQLELFPNLPTVRNPLTYWARYKSYLRSAAWRRVTEETKRLAGYVCERCGREEDDLKSLGVSLDGHHRTYINVFRETPGVDTMCVCRPCHGWIHSHPRIAANDNWRFRKTG